REVFALEVEGRAAGACCQARGAEEGRRAARIVAQQGLELCLKARVVARDLEGFGQLFERGHQGFGDVATAVAPPVAARVRVGECGFAHLRRSPAELRSFKRRPVSFTSAA